MSAARGQHLIGKKIGSCVIEKQLGQGGSSAVFLAREGDTEQKVAIKVFLTRSNMSVQMQKEFYNRFLLEAEAVSKLDHPNILPIYSYGEQDGLPYIIMPYIEGGTLSEFLARRGRLSLQEASWYLEQIASALDYAHEEHGYVHCDVKPANILLDTDGTALLTDFGITHMMQPGSISGSSGQPATKPPQMLMGTPDFISPEQALGHPLDGRSDVYSLGITLFYLLSGRLPFKADSTIAMALLHLHETPPSLSMLRADIPQSIDSVIQKALAKRPEARYQTAGEFSAAFAQAIQGSEKVYEIDLEGNPHTLIPGHAEGINTTTLRTMIAAKPVVRVKPAKRRAFGLLQTVMAIMVLLALTVGAAWGGETIASRFATMNNAPKVRVQLTVPVNAAGDYLVDNADWPASSTFFFVGEQYHIQNTSENYVAIALYAHHQYTNFRLSVTMSEIHGSGNLGDYYGVAFRGLVNQSRYYLFEITPAGGGQYSFSRYDNNGVWHSISYGPVSAIVAGIGKSNTITVIARGTSFSFLINGVPVGNPIPDNSKQYALSSGEVGLSVEAKGTEVAFSHLYIDPLK